MSWPSPINGGQGSWTTKLVIGALAFVFLLAIGYYNGRQAHPELFDPDYVSAPKPTPTAFVPGAYPQIDMTEALAKEAAEAKKEAEKAKQKAAKEQKEKKPASDASPSASAETAAANSSAASTEDNASSSANSSESSSATPSASASAASAEDNASSSANTSESSSATPSANGTPTVSASASPDASSSALPSANPSANASPEQSAATANDPDGSPSPSPTAPQLQDGANVPSMVYDTSWPPPPNRPRTESTFMQRIPTMLFFLAIVCVMIWISLRLIAPLTGKLTGNTAKKKQITVVERQSLAPNKVLFLVTVADKKLLLGVSDKSITTLTEWEEKPSAPAADSDSNPPASPPGEAEPPKNLVKEVIAKHLEALPSLTK